MGSLGLAGHLYQLSGTQCLLDPLSPEWGSPPGGRLILIHLLHILGNRVSEGKCVPHKTPLLTAHWPGPNPMARPRLGYIVFHMGSSVPVKNWDIVSKKEEKDKCWVEIYQLMTNYFGLCYSMFLSNYKTTMVLGFALAPCRSRGHLCDWSSWLTTCWARSAPGCQQYKLIGAVGLRQVQARRARFLLRSNSNSIEHKVTLCWACWC